MKIVVGEIISDVVKQTKLRKMTGYDEFPTKDGIIFGIEVDYKGIYGFTFQEVFSKMHTEAEKVLPRVRKILPSAQPYVLSE